MKTKIFYLLLLLTIFGTACKPTPKSEEPVAPVTLDILGTWRSVSCNGQSLTTNERTIVSYISSSKKTMSLARYIPEFEEFTWRNKAMGDYTFDGLNLQQDAADPGTSHLCTATAIDAQSMRVCYNTFVNKQGEQTPMNETVVYERVQENMGYDQFILGLWEGVSQTGQQTFGDEHHRWEYKDIDRSGYYTYVYYDYDPLLKQWVANPQTISDYNIHGSWLATRWQPQGSFTTNYEWWDIDYINDSTMKWSALREDSLGQTFVATFTFRRVVDE